MHRALRKTALRWLPLLLVACTTPQQQARETLDAGIEAATRGDSVVAMTSYELATRQDPALAAAWVRLSDARFDAQQWQGARDAAMQASKLQPSQPEHHERIGRASAGLEDWDGAAEAYVRAYSLDQTRVGLILDIALADERRGRREDALAGYELALEENVRPGFAALALARLHAEAQEMTEAQHFLAIAADHEGTWTEEDRQVAEQVEERIAADRRARQPEFLSAVRSGGGAKGTSLQEIITNIDEVSSKGKALFRVSGTFVKKTGDAPDQGSYAKAPGNTSAVKGRVSRVSSQAKISNGYDRSKVLRVVAQASGALRLCYDNRLKAEPTISGRLVVDWTIESSGKVINARVASSTLGDYDVARCMLERIRGLQFPPPAKGPVNVRLPFVLRAIPTGQP